MARGALSSGDPFGWREPSLPLGRAAGVVDAVDGWRAEGARIVLASDQAARLAELLGGGRPVGRGRRAHRRARRRRAPWRSSSAASTAGSPAARTGSSSSPTASCSGRSASVGRGRSGGSCPRDILERLTPGDLVVHIDHGIARYEQMLRRGGAGEERDYLEL